MIKGPWGIGKTSAVLSLLNPANGKPPEDLEVKMFAYVSLAGVKELNDERSVFLSGLERFNGAALGKIKSASKILSKTLSGVVSLGGYGSRLSGLAELAALGASGLMSNALVVFDDLERRATALELQEVLGCVMRLVETRGCRVLVICNEDALAKDLDVLNLQREKVFDLEYAFEPSVKDLVSALVAGDSVRKWLLRAFEPLGIRNLRVLAKAAGAVAHFQRNLTTWPAPTRDRILENVAHITALRWQIGQPIQAGDLEAGAILKLRSEVVKSFQPSPLQQALMRSDFIASVADPLVLEYLSSGKLNSVQLEQAASVEARRAQKSLASDLADRLVTAYWDTFAPIPRDLIAEGQQLLEEPFHDHEWSALLKIILVFQHLKMEVDHAALERRWAREWEWEDRLASEALMQLQGEEARTIFTARMTERQVRNLQPREVFVHMLITGGFNGELLKTKEFRDPDWLCNALKQVHVPGLPERLGTLSRLLRATPELKDASESLEQALQSLSPENTANEARVRQIRHNSEQE